MKFYGKNWILLAAFIMTLFFVVTNGCSGKLGLDENTVYVANINLYNAGRLLNSSASVNVGDHYVIEARPLNKNSEIVANSSVAFSAADDAIVKVLSTYASSGSSFAIVKGVERGTSEVIAQSGGISKHIQFGVGNSAGGNLAYVKFNNASSDPLSVGASREYTADYIDVSGATKEASLVWSLPNETYARIASSSGNKATVTGISTGEVTLLVRDAANTVAAGILIRVN
ncbi:MAG: hypothetical protein QMC67_07320 [Candidatus Wallbacteria bacterium]